MKKTIFKKFASIALALSLVFSLAATSFAADITTSGGNASTPVYLSSTSDGTLSGEPVATALSATVPTALPMAVSQDGTVTTADDCKIVNNSYGAVRVKTATINSENGWSLTAFGSKDTLASEKVDSNKIGFAMTIGEGQQVATDDSNADTQTLIDAPVTGCYMSGVGDTSNNSISVDYDAIVTPLSVAADETTVASVVFVVEWDSAS